MKNLDRCSTKVKIEIETWNLGDFFLFISNHIGAQKLEHTQNKDHPTIDTS